MKIVATSDTHGFLPSVPPCDLLLLAGDITPVRDHRVSRQRKWLDEEFRHWLEDVPARHIVGIAGNHDFVFDQEITPRGNADGYYDEKPWGPPSLPWTYLQDSGTEVEGLKIYGVPWTPYFGGWAFNLPRGDRGAQAEEIFAQVPEDTDILVTHGPPYLVADRTTTGDHPGCTMHLHHLKRIRPLLNVFGHIHEQGGVRLHRAGSGTTCANVSYVNALYEPRQNDLEMFYL